MDKKLWLSAAVCLKNDKPFNFMWAIHAGGRLAPLRSGMDSESFGWFAKSRTTTRRAKQLSTPG
jgi:hypothetical protein